MAIARVNCAWQNWPGAPGVSTFFFSTIAQTRVDALRTFFNSLTNYLPNGLTIQVPATGDYISETTGAITGSWSVGTLPAVVLGTSTAAYAGNAGIVAHWLTSSIVGTRRLRGKTFIVPVTSLGFENNGTPTATLVSGVTTAATSLITTVSPDMVVWSRPVAAHTQYDPKTGVGTAVPARAGSVGAVTSVRVPDLAVSMRSRRV